MLRREIYVVQHCSSGCLNYHTDAVCQPAPSTSTPKAKQLTVVDVVVDLIPSDGQVVAVVMRVEA